MMNGWIDLWNNVCKKLKNIIKVILFSFLMKIIKLIPTYGHQHSAACMPVMPIDAIFNTDEMRTQINVYFIDLNFIFDY